jgi:hypothetical protein
MGAAQVAPMRQCINANRGNHVAPVPMRFQSAARTKIFDSFGQSMRCGSESAKCVGPGTHYQLGNHIEHQ